MKEISWKYVKALKNVGAVDDFEKKHSIVLPKDLKGIILKYNGGRPSCKYYDTDSEKDKEFKTLLSFNEDDIETIYKHFPLDSSDKTLVPFASDPAGNYFVVKGMKIYLWNHETDSCLLLSDTFSDFLKLLHD